MKTVSRVVYLFLFQQYLSTFILLGVIVGTNKFDRDRGVKSVFMIPALPNIVRVKHLPRAFLFRSIAKCSQKEAHFARGHSFCPFSGKREGRKPGGSLP